MLKMENTCCQKLTKQSPSIEKRYFVTLLSNFVIFIASFVTAGIVPRALGPQNLGDFGFLSRISAALRGVFNMEASSAFFTLASKQHKSGPLVKLYSGWLIAQLFLIIGVIIFAFVLGVGSLIWPGQKFKYILWVAIFDWVFFLGTTLKALADAKGFTIKAQLINLFVSVANICVLVVFASKGILTLGVYIAIQTFTSGMLCFVLIQKIILPNREIYWSGNLKSHLREFRKYFYRYCSPLVVYGLVSFIFEYFDRMILQRFSGSVQQGYFQIAFSWASFPGLFTASVTSIYKREITNSNTYQSKIHTADIFSKYLKMIYFFTLIFSVYLCLHSRELLSIIAGPQFKFAAPVLTVMAFYPIFQVYGQLGGSVFLATERTVMIRNLGIFAMLVGIPLTYVFVAPANLPIPGLGLGSLGLALKTVIWNLIVVQVYLWYNCKFFQVKIYPFWWHQIYTAVLLVAVAFITKTGAAFIFQSADFSSVVPRLVIDTLLYFSIVAFLIYFYPQFISVKREEINLLIKKIKSLFGRNIKS